MHPPHILPESLFSPRHPANPKVFVGRDSILERLNTGCTSGSSYGVIGEPGIGKTSLLFAVKNTIALMQQNGPVVSFPVYLEFNKTKFKTSVNILNAILQGFIEEINRLTGLVFPEELVISDENLIVFDKVWNSILSWYEKESHRECRLVLLFDDLHRGADLNCLTEAFSILRPIVSREQISVVLCGEMPLEKEFRNDVSSLRNLVSGQIHLQPLLKDDVRKILSIVEDYDWIVENGVLDLLFEFTDGHPYFVHYFLLESIRKHRKVSVESIKDVNTNDRFFLDGMTKKRLESNAEKIATKIKDISVNVGGDFSGNLIVGDDNEAKNKS